MPAASAVPAAPVPDPVLPDGVYLEPVAAYDIPATCSPAALEAALAPLRYRLVIGCDEVSAATARELLTQAAGLGGDAAALHRMLLAARKAAGPHTLLGAALRQALSEVREHSRLYTPRTCECVVGPWRAFATRLHARLREQLPDGRPLWIGWSERVFFYDAHGDAAEVVQRWLTRPKKAGRLQVHAAPGWVQWTFAAPTSDGLGFREPVEWGVAAVRTNEQARVQDCAIRLSPGATYGLGFGAQMLRYPNISALLLALADNFRLRPEQCRGHNAVTALYTAGYEGWPEEARQVACALAPDWSGDLDGLLLAARTVAEPLVPRPA